MTAKLVTDRRGAIARARAKVEARDDVRPERQHMTKAERLASPTSNGKRETGSNKERRSTVETVRKAMESLAHMPSDADLGDRTTRTEAQREFRTTRDKLRQRYPGQTLAQMVETAERQEAAFKDDPVATREALIAQYARMPRENLPEYRKSEHRTDTRSAIRRAMQDRQDAEELSAAESKYGRGLAQILKQIESFDAGMIEDPHGTSARLATTYGAPAVAGDVPAYEERQAVKVYQKEVKQRFEVAHGHLDALIRGGYIPRDADTHTEMAAVMQLPTFLYDDDPQVTMWRAAQIVAHPSHVRITPRTVKAATSKRRDPGALSISGGSAGAHYPNNNGRRSTRDVLRSHLADA